nr:EOG090X0CJ3 [Lepidurus arcticus]
MDEVKIQEDANNRLQFQDFNLSQPTATVIPIEKQGNKPSGMQTHNFTDFPDSAVDDEDGSAGKVLEFAHQNSPPSKKICLMPLTCSPILSFDLEQPVPLKQAWSVQITEPKNTSKIIQSLTLPDNPNPFMHLKRVKSIKRSPKSKPEIWILLQFTESYPTTQTCLDSLDPVIPGLLPPINDWQKVMVPSTAPRTRVQYDECMKYWPCNFHADIFTESLLSQDFLSPQEISVASNLTRRAFQNNTVVIAKYGEILAESSADLSHPLQHAAMRALDVVARNQGGGVWQNTLPMSSHEDPSAYLCTGYDAYLRLEPCCMCAMALLHSRENAGASTGTSKFWTMSFYQQFFDVDTSDVVTRLVWSMVPRPSAPFLQQFVRPKPDLYGPVWVGFTLVFFIAIMGNIADYLATAGSASHWKYDFQKVSISGTCIFLYGWVLPVMLWAVLWWKQEKGVSLLELLCLYGYSLAVYIPVSMLWAIPVPVLQWILVFGAAALSGAVLVIALGHALRDSSQNVRFPMLAIVLACHLALAAGLQLYFFRASPTLDLSRSTVNVTKRSDMPLMDLKLDERSPVYEHEQFVNELLLFSEAPKNITLSNQHKEKPVNLNAIETDFKPETPHFQSTTTAGRRPAGTGGDKISDL